MRECKWCGKPEIPKEIHCGSTRCRRLYAYWSQPGRRTSPPIQEAWRGSLVALYQIAEFLQRMALPKTPLQRQFAKRYQGSTLHNPRYRFRPHST